MANNYYNFPTPFVPGTKVRSEQVNVQYQGLESAFDLLPTDPASSVIGTAWLGTDVQGATVNDYLLTTPDPQSALANGQRVAFFATHTNDGAATINVDTLGVVNLVDNGGIALAANDIISGQYYEVVYDSANTQFVMSLAAGDTSTFPQITATSTNVIDLVDADVALRVGAVDPLTASHLELDPTTIQAKSDATNVNQLQLNPLGGEVAIGNQSGPPTGEGILLYQDGFEMANIDRSALALSAAVVADTTVPGAYEYLIEFYDQDANDFWGSIGWDPATTDMRFRQLGDGGGYIFSGTLDSGGEVELLSMDPEEGINFLSSGNGPLFVEPAGVSTVSGATYIDNGATVYMAEISAAQVDIGGYGQIWVNDAFTPNRLFFTGDTGVDVDLTTVGGSPGGADTQVQFNNSGVFGGSARFTFDDTTVVIDSDAATTVNAVEITAATIADGVLLDIGSAGANHAFANIYSHVDHASAAGDNMYLEHFGTGLLISSTISGTGGGMQLFRDGVTGTQDLMNLTDTAVGQSGDMLSIVTAGTGHSINITKTGTDGAAIRATSASATATSGDPMLYLENLHASSPANVAEFVQNGTGLALAVVGPTEVEDIDITTSIRLTERADHFFTPAATFGELWVRSDGPNILVFTDDAGTDFDLNVAGAGLFTEDGDGNIVGGANAGGALVGASALNNWLSGNGAGNLITTGDGNICIGAAGTRITTPSDNICIGNAGASITIGISNIAIGDGALNDNTSTFSHTSNIAIGTQAMNSSALSTAGSNVAIGNGGMSAIINGASNIAIGTGALDEVTTGDDNIGIGNDAGSGLNTGDYNVAIGFQTGRSGTGGTTHRNVCIGYNSGRNLGGGEDNVIIGSENADSTGGTRTLGDRNIIVGGDNLQGAPFTGNPQDMVIFGFDNLQALTTGDANQAFGRFCLNNVTTGTGNLALGFVAGPAVAGAGATQNNRFYLRMTGSPNETPNIGFDPNGGETGDAEFTVSADGNGNDFVVHDNSTAGETRMMIYDVDNATLEQVSVGAADSGGTNFKLLRIPN